MFRSVGHKDSRDDGEIFIVLGPVSDDHKAKGVDYVDHAGDDVSRTYPARLVFV